MGKIVLTKNEDSNGTHYDVIDVTTNKKVAEIPTNYFFATDEIEDKINQHLKGFIFDSLVYRYKNAREKLAIYEEQEKKKRGEPFEHIKKNAERDIMRFIQILDEGIGDHD